MNQHSKNNLSPENVRLYSEDGVDLSLIRWMLSMTPTERLQTLQQNIRSIMRLRGAKTNSGFFGNSEDSGDIDDPGPETDGTQMNADFQGFL